MKVILLKYLLSGLVLAALLSGCKASKCDCPKFHGEMKAERVDC